MVGAARHGANVVCLGPAAGAKAMIAAYRETWEAHNPDVPMPCIGLVRHVVVADTREPLLGIRQLRFANGVRLNLKRTGLEKDGVLVQLHLDGGQMLASRDNPLAVDMVPVLAAGGLGKHSQDEL